MLYLSGRFFLAAMVFLSISRMLLCVWQWRRVRAGGGILPVLLGGWRIDLSFVSMMLAFPMLLAPWLGHLSWALMVAQWWFGLCWFILVFLEISTPQFIVEYDSRPNRLFVEYLVHPREVCAMLWRGYKFILLFGAGLLILLMWLGLCWIYAHGGDPMLVWWQRCLLSVVLFCVLFLAARGTLGHRPLNASQVAFSSDAMLNMLPLNSAFVVAHAVRGMRADKPSTKAYGHLPTARIQAIVRTCSGLTGAPLDVRSPTRHRQIPVTRCAHPSRIVIIIEESLGAQFVGCLGGRALTPELDTLASQGWLLERLYATGTRSVRGLEALLTGFLPTPAEAVVKRPRSQRHFFTIAALLRHHGYHSRFIYGGEAHFDNMKGFLLGNGFDEVIDRPRFRTKPGFVGSWGASDEDMFNELHQRLMDDGAMPSLSVAFSVSNHTPWEYPAGRIQVTGEAASVDNTVRYADWALGRFFERARESSYWEHTIFMVVADHDARVGGASLVPVRHFHIPALILGEGVPARSDARLASQIDLPSTLLSLAGVDCVHPMPGVDLARCDPSRAMMQYGDNYGYLKHDTLLVMEPYRPPSQFSYCRDGEVLTPQNIDAALAEEALAHALWPDWAYFNQAYQVAATGG